MYKERLRMIIKNKECENRLGKEGMAMRYNSNKDILNVIKIGVICWILVFIMDYLPYDFINKYLTDWWQDGIIETTALVLFLLMIFCILVFIQWKIYEEKHFCEWDIKKLLIVTFAVFFIKRFLERKFLHYKAGIDINDLRIGINSYSE